MCEIAGGPSWLMVTSTWFATGIVWPNRMHGFLESGGGGGAMHLAAHCCCVLKVVLLSTTGEVLLSTTQLPVEAEQLHGLRVGGWHVAIMKSELFMLPSVRSAESD